MEPAAIRYKNPGAMWPGKIATKWGSKTFVSLNDGTGQGNKIAVFETWVQGICAQLDLWRTSANYKNKRFADAIAIWSGHNNVPSYIAYVKARVPGMTENTVMNDTFWKSPMGIQFLKAQSGHEAGKPLPAPDADWIEAQRRVFSGVAVATTTKTVIVAAVATGSAAAANATSSEGLDWGMIGIVGIVALLIGVLGVWLYHKYRDRHYVAAAPIPGATIASTTEKKDGL